MNLAAGISNEFQPQVGPNLFFSLTIASTTSQQNLQSTMISINTVTTSHTTAAKIWHYTDDDDIPEWEKDLMERQARMSSAAAG